MTLFVILFLALVALKLDGVNEPNQVTWFGSWDSAAPAGRVSAAADSDATQNN
jgi:hypothetical protein